MINVAVLGWRTLSPEGITMDPRGALRLCRQLRGQHRTAPSSINPVDGLALRNFGPTAVATGPTCVTIDPALGIYLYTSNAIDNSVSA